MNKKLWQEMMDGLQENKKAHHAEGGEFYFEKLEEYDILISGLYALKNSPTDEHTVIVDGVKYVKKEA